MVSLAFSGNAAAHDHINRMDKKVAGLVIKVKKWREAEKVALEKAKKAKEQALKAKEARKKAEVDLSWVRSEHSDTSKKHFSQPSTKHGNRRSPSTRNLNSSMPVFSPNVNKA